MNLVQYIVLDDIVDKVNVIKKKKEMTKFNLLQLYTLGRQYILSIMNKNKCAHCACALTLALTSHLIITVKP